MPKFGGPGRKKKRCLERICSGFAPKKQGEVVQETPNPTVGKGRICSGFAPKKQGEVVKETPNPTVAKGRICSGFAPKKQGEVVKETPNPTVAKGFSMEILRSDINTLLTPLGWLNDQVCELPLIWVQ